MYITFNSLIDAENADKLISQNMGLTGDITSNWDNPIKLINGKYAIAKPEERFMIDVNDYTEQENIELPEMEY